MSCNQIRVRICRCSILKCCKRNTKTYIYEICYNNQGIFSKYETNLKTMILQRSLNSLGLLLSLFEFNNFSSLIDIIDTHYQNSPMAVQYHMSCDTDGDTWPWYCFHIAGVLQTFVLYNLVIGENSGLVKHVILI